MRHLFLAIVALAFPAAAQTVSQVDPVTGGGISWQVNEVVGDGSTPNGGTPPAEAEMPPAVADNVDTSLYITAGGVSYTPVSGAPYEPKVRFTCAAAKAGFFDPVRLPGQDNAGHFHEFFGNKAIGSTASYASLRAHPDSTCGGGPINGSGYWSTAVMKPSVFSPGKALAKKFDVVNLYYVGDKCYVGTTYDTPNICQRLRRGLKLVFGFGMDNDWSAYRAQIAAYSTAHPELGGMTMAYAGGTWHCENSNGSYSGSPWAGNGDQPYLANADGTEAIRCPTNEQIISTVDSNICWNGHLSAVDGYSNTVPSVVFGVDGKSHCPNHFWRLPLVRRLERYTHTGPADYRAWFCSADAMAGTAAGRTMKPCESEHTDYQFGWMESVSDKWQCKGLGITIGSCTGTTSQMDYNTISSTERLISDSPDPRQPSKQIVYPSQRQDPTKPASWFVPPAAAQGPYSGHAGMVM